MRGIVQDYIHTSIDSVGTNGSGIEFQFKPKMGEIYQPIMFQHGWFKMQKLKKLNRLRNMLLYAQIHYGELH